MNVRRAVSENIFQVQDRIDLKTTNRRKYLIISQRDSTSDLCGALEDLFSVVQFVCVNFKKSFSTSLHFSHYNFLGYFFSLKLFRLLNYRIFDKHVESYQHFFPRPLSRGSGYCHYHIWLCGVFRFRAISPKPSAGLFSYCILDY